MMFGCHECLREDAVHFNDARDRAECAGCGRVWSVQWVTAHGFPCPKLDLVDEGDDHWVSLGTAATNAIGSAMVAKRNDMSGLKRMMDHHKAGLVCSGAEE